MKNKSNLNHDISRIEDLLRSIQPVPGKEFHRRMESAPWNTPGPKEKRSFGFKRYYKLAGIMACAMILIGLAFTPAGKVLAEEIIHFFNQVTGNTLPLQSDEVVEVLPTATPQPTYYPALLPADQVQPTEVENESTPVAAPQLDPDQLQDLDSMTARSLVDFSLLEPSVLPDGYRLQNIRFDDSQKALLFTYTSGSTGTGAYFVLIQGRNLTSLQIPDDATRETILANGKQVEWISGQKPLADGASTVLRWEQDGVELMMELYPGGGQGDSELQQEDWVAVVNGLTACPTSGSKKDYACEVNRAAIAAGFTPWQFPQAPDGYSFKNVYYKAGLTAIWYASSAGELGLLQSEEDFKTQETSDWFSVPQDAIQEVTVAGQAAEYVNGSFIAQPGKDHAIWNPDSGQIRLRWKQADGWFQFVKWGAPEMQPQELADLAAGLTADPAQVHTDLQTNSAADTMTIPEVYLTLADAEKAYGKKFLQPAVLPADLPFSHARLSAEDGIMLFYGDFAEDKMHMNSDAMVFIQGKKTSSFQEIYRDYPPEAIADAQVDGHPAKLITGTMQIGSFDENGQQLLEAPTWKKDPYMLTLYWEVDSQYFVLRFFSVPESGARLDASSLIAVAESLH